jgi:hypothetical protein
MKKIVSIVVLFIAFSFNANAQESKSVQVTEDSKEMEIKSLINGLESIPDLSPQLKQDFATLISMREEAVSKVKTKEEKSAIYQQIARKLIYSLTEEQKSALEKNTDLYKKLTTYSGN